MNASKARDYFSDYFEGTLEPGLKQAFERRLKTDAIIQAEYRAFERSMQQLGSYCQQPVEVPAYLSEMISSRLEKQLAEVVQKKSLFSTVFGRSMLLTGAAAASIFAVYLQTRPSNGPSTSSILPSISSASEVGLVVSNGQTRLSYRAYGQERLVVRDAASGQMLQEFVLDSNQLDSPLQNRKESAALIAVEISSSRNKMVFALPGRERIDKNSGEGTVGDLALALADYYHVPVLVKAVDLSSNYRWKFPSRVTSEAVTTTIEPADVQIDMRQNVLYLSRR